MKEIFSISDLIQRNASQEEIFNEIMFEFQISEENIRKKLIDFVINNDYDELLSSLIELKCSEVPFQTILFDCFCQRKWKCLFTLLKYDFNINIDDFRPQYFFPLMDEIFFFSSTSDTFRQINKSVIIVENHLFCIYDTELTCYDLIKKEIVDYTDFGEKVIFLHSDGVNHFFFTHTKIFSFIFESETKSFIPTELFSLNNGVDVVYSLINCADNEYFIVHFCAESGEENLLFLFHNENGYEKISLSCFNVQDISAIQWLKKEALIIYRERQTYRMRVVDLEKYKSNNLTRCIDNTLLIDYDGENDFSFIFLEDGKHFIASNETRLLLYSYTIDFETIRIIFEKIFEFDCERFENITCSKTSINNVNKELCFLTEAGSFVCDAEDFLSLWVVNEKVESFKSMQKCLIQSSDIFNTLYLQGDEYLCHVLRNSICLLKRVSTFEEFKHMVKASISVLDEDITRNHAHLNCDKQLLYEFIVKYEIMDVQAAGLIKFMQTAIPFEVKAQTKQPEEEEEESEFGLYESESEADANVEDHAQQPEEEEEEEESEFGLYESESEADANVEDHAQQPEEEEEEEEELVNSFKKLKFSTKHSSCEKVCIEHSIRMHLILLINKYI
eukprot:TRINITY_DN3193_c4_g5_i5.p1 TRINITY_DN3193_c4_g5~~TRINITY_DN3193_c4_g5_i5.p1  ORF type:complete len:632 (+),score=194.18 TRINITY_DN3193_c4_g5_i5:49-1896(+)